MRSPIQGLGFIALTFGCVGTLRGQSPSVQVTGIVRDTAGAPLPGVNVFRLETLDGALSAPDGGFAFTTRDSGTFTLVARQRGFREWRRAFTPSPSESLSIILQPGAATLARITVQAGRHVAGGESGATLSALDVVSTPGAAADINRALQMVPGVQAVDEGNGLFVRGGDYTETKVFLNGGEMINAVQLQRHSGTFVGTVDPFLLDGIYFAAGGMGARYGNALSGIAALHTLGRPSRRTATASAGLAAFSLSAALDGAHGTGIRLAANRFDLQPLIAVNGSPRAYAPPPHGFDLSGSAHWSYGSAGEVRLFVVRQSNGFTTQSDQPTLDGSYSLDVADRFAVLSWSDVRGSFAPSLSISSASMKSGEAFGPFLLDSRRALVQLSAQSDWTVSDPVIVRGGAQISRDDAGFDGTIPASGDDQASDARTHILASQVDGGRFGVWSELDWRPADRLRLVTGIRVDHSSLTNERTIDPRLSLAYMPFRNVTFTAAWGIYHQVPDALYYDEVLGRRDLPSMRAMQSILGAQVGSPDGVLARLELHAKQYRSLAQLTRDYVVVGHGRGDVRGVDFFLKGPLVAGLAGRVTYSGVHSRRTDPHTGRDVRAPFDVTHSLTVVAERSWPRSVRTAAAWRYATGRPVTPVISAIRDAARDLWLPVYGEPMSERLPAFARLDLSASHFRMLTPSLQGVVFVALTNVLDRTNVYAYRYSADYRIRTPVRSVFNRSIYFGASLTKR